MRHRAVADRAGLPLAATTYYFDSREDLVEHALHRVAAARIAASRAVVEGLPAGPAPASPAAVARAVVAVVVGGWAVDRGALLTTYERMVQAGRDPRLGPLVRGWNAEIEGLLEQVLAGLGGPARPGLARLLLAATDGLLIAALVEGEDPVPSAAAALLPALRG